MGADREEVAQEWLRALRLHRDELKRLFEESSNHWGFEDPLYRFYHLAIRYAELSEPPRPLPSGYAALLYSYGLR